MNDKLKSEFLEYLEKKAEKDKNFSHLKKTPERFLKFVNEFTEGYNTDIKESVREGIFDLDQPSKTSVQIEKIHFSTVCIHHLLPFHGEISVEYLPDKKIFGLSKIPRICTLLSKRFNLQESLTEDIGNMIYELLEPKYVIVKISASHGCMSCRGIKSINAVTNTEYQIGKK